MVPVLARGLVAAVPDHHVASPGGRDHAVVQLVGVHVRGHDPARHCGPGFRPGPRTGSGPEFAVPGGADRSQPVAALLRAAPVNQGLEPAARVRVGQPRQPHPGVHLGGRGPRGELHERLLPAVERAPGPGRLAALHYSPAGAPAPDCDPRRRFGAAGASVVPLSWRTRASSARAVSRSRSARSARPRSSPRDSSST